MAGPRGFELFSGYIVRTCQCMVYRVVVNWCESFHFFHRVKGHCTKTELGKGIAATRIALSLNVTSTMSTILPEDNSVYPPMHI